MNELHLSKEQKLASEHISGPALTLAVPGSGKTTLLMWRTMNLIQNHRIPAENILTVTFSKASAEDMKRRFHEIFPEYRGALPAFMTIHSFCYNILRQYQKKHHLDLKLIDSSGFSKFALLKSIVSDISTELISDEALEQLINEIGYVKNMMLSKNEFEAHTTHKDFGAIYERYETYKKKQHLIDFDDMLTMTYNILKSSESALSFLQQRYPHIQVDEAQDTSNIQFEILKLLSGKHPNVFMVADDDQSIYAFRGANPQNLLDFEGHFGKASTYYLSANYRSTPSICQVSNAFIEQNTARYEKTMVPQSRHDDVPVILNSFEDLISRNDYLLHQIAEKATRDNTVAILYRNNSSAIGLSYLMHKAGIEFYIKDKVIHFFNHFVIQDILNFMQLALADNDLRAFQGIASRTGIFIAKDAVDYVQAYNRGRNVFDTLLEYKGLSKQQAKQVSLYKDALVSMANNSAINALRTIEKDFGYLQRIEKMASRYDSNSDGIKKILTQLKIIARQCDSITAFLTEIEWFKTSLLSYTAHYNCPVQFSTFHSSKGLEYETVFIIDLFEKEYDKQTLLLEEEERRLFYVAMTRAKQHLHILSHKFEEGRYLKEVSYLKFIKDQSSEYIRIEKHRLETKAIACDIAPGAIIEHQKFGRGHICNIDGDTLTIEFPDKVRNLSYALCKEKGLL
ncbi:MAG: ATP-dependent helicase [Clostridia bacterium]|nr:ATP-dependent helicase [Clostridia bacterium]